MPRRVLLFAVVAAALSAANIIVLRAQTPLPTASAEDRALALSIFKELIETNTTDTPRGNVTAASTAMKKRFIDAGFAPQDVRLIGPDSRKMNLVVRMRAAGTPTAKPVLFLCHLDVVEAIRSDWTTDPFALVMKDGFFYGRGTEDMKEGDATMVATFIRLHREGYRPKRDLILALTADEEGGRFNGAQWLVNQHSDLVDAAYVINLDAGGVQLEQGKPVVAAVEATEKIYSDFQVTAVNRGGHSSLPRPDNAIYELTSALNKLQAFVFPFELNEVTRAYFSKLAERENPQMAATLRAILASPPDTSAIAKLSTEPSFNANLRTTCVATRLTAGHANNALPQTAQAIVNCRIFPGHSPEEIRQKLISIFGDDHLSVKYVSDAGQVSDTAPARKAIAPPEQNPEIFDPLTRFARAIWPGVPVSAVMENGASDSIYFALAGIPCYGFSAIAMERNDDRVHGRDERIPVDSFWKSLDFYDAFTRALGAD